MRPSHFYYKRGHQWSWREQKHLWTSFFNHQQDDRHRLPLPPNYVPRGETVTSADIHKALAKIREVFGLKRPSMSVPNLFIVRLSPKLPSPLLFFNNWHWKRASRCSPSSIIAIFHTTGLLSLPQNKIRAGKLLIDLVHLQEERLGGRPYYRYRRARRHCPVVDRVLQIKIQIADDHG